MPQKSFSSRQFNQDASGAKKAANDGPVFITDRGKPSHVLLTFETYVSLTNNKSIVELLAMDDTVELEFSPPRAEGLIKPAELD